MLATNEEIYFRLNLLGANPNIFQSDSLSLLKKEKLRKYSSERALVKFENSQLNSALRKSSCSLGDTKIDESERYSQIPDDEMDHEDVFFLNSDKNIYENTIVEDPKLEQTEQDKAIHGDKSNEISSIRIMENYCQLTKLQEMISKMNSSPKEKVVIKAYRSKMKSKFFREYENNSKDHIQKTKYKIFHRCKFPTCSRTFASSGWLKSHFEEHLREIQKNKFNEQFAKLI